MNRNAAGLLLAAAGVFGDVDPLAGRPMTPQPKCGRRNEDRRRKQARKMAAASRRRNRGR